MMGPFHWWERHKRRKAAEQWWYDQRPPGYVIMPCLSSWEVSGMYVTFYVTGSPHQYLGIGNKWQAYETVRRHYQNRIKDDRVRPYPVANS